MTKKYEEPDEIQEAPDIGTSRDFNHAHPLLVERYRIVQAAYEASFPGRRLIVTCTYRSPEEQRRLYRKGRFGDHGATVTNADGFTKKSRHNYFPSQALDVAVVEGGKAIWDEAVYYPLGPLCKENDLEWGGFFTSIFDFPHIQLPKEDV